jgi:hypothetical protein
MQAKWVPTWVSKHYVKDERGSEDQPSSVRVWGGDSFLVCPLNIVVGYGRVDDYISRRYAVYKYSLHSVLNVVYL